ncbi:MAG: HEAT repeat domain-containing protein [Longimicrobiales bacterium]
MAAGSDVPDLNQGEGEQAASSPPPGAPPSTPDAQPGPAPAPARRVAPSTETPAEHELSAVDVSHLFTALDKAVRARRLYHAKNPTYLNFLAALRDAFTRLWALTNSISVAVEEHNFRWGEVPLSAGEGRDNLAFLFYKDGIRYLTFLPTFEEELERFLEIVHRARSLDNNADDDMVTILWEREFAAFQYSYVDALSEGLILPDVVPLKEAQSGKGEYVRQEIQSDAAAPTDQPFAMQHGMPSVAASITRDDFEETVYFLDSAELEQLREEVEKEAQRELKADVLSALFDRLEDQVMTRQTEIVRILRQLMPAFLARGDLASASTILVELSALVEVNNILGAEQAKEARALFDELSEPAVLAQLLKSLEEGAIDPSGVELGVFLRHLGSQALPLLIRTTETTTVPALQTRLRTASEHLGRAHTERLIELIRSEDELIALGAGRLSGQLALPLAAPALAALMSRPSAPLRRAAVESLIQIRSGAALEALQAALEDGDRDVRVTAVRGLASLRYQPARQRLETIIGSSWMRGADLTEKIAFFEAFGAVANAESVTKLDRLLNGKNLLRQKQPAEVRACAAMALGRVGTPASRAALDRATSETHPMVRNAVLKALRQEVPAQ